MLEVFFVGVPGFEPGKAGPESAVLPLHHIPILFDFGCKGTNFSSNIQIFWRFFLLAAYFYAIMALLAHLLSLLSQWHTHCKRVSDTLYIKNVGNKTKLEVKHKKLYNYGKNYWN